MGYIQIMGIFASRQEKGVAWTKSGIDFEKSGDNQAAINAFEKAVSLRFDGSRPYDRLAIIYRKEKKYDDEIRICKAYLSLHTRNDDPKRSKFQKRIEKAAQLKEDAKD